MAAWQTCVELELASIEAAEWAALEGGRNLYLSYPWLCWAESSCGAAPAYVLARDAGGRLVGAVPTYLVTGVDTSWNSWYDPLTVLVGDRVQAAARRPAWFPLLALGSLSGYRGEILLEPSLTQLDRRDVIGALMRRCGALAGALGAKALAMMYVSQPVAIAAAQGLAGSSKPILTSAGASIDARWPDLDAFLNAAPRRRRNNMQREMEVFRTSASRVVESRLADCLEAVGPLLGNVHRRHGAEDSDRDTTDYLRSQAAHLNDVSRVFLEVLDGQPVGFSLCYEWGRRLYVRVVGFDYERSARFAYFNLAYYLPLAHAIRRGLTCIDVGPGTYEAKTGRGAVLDPTWALVWQRDQESRAWFDSVSQVGEDAREAARWLPPVSSGSREPE